MAQYTTSTKGINVLRTALDVSVEVVNDRYQWAAMLWNDDEQPRSLKMAHLPSEDDIMFTQFLNTVNCIFDLYENNKTFSLENIHEFAGFFTYLNSYFSRIRCFDLHTTISGEEFIFPRVYDGYINETKLNSKVKNLIDKITNQLYKSTYYTSYSKYYLDWIAVSPFTGGNKFLIEILICILYHNNTGKYIRFKSNYEQDYKFDRRASYRSTDFIGI